MNVTMKVVLSQLFLLTGTLAFTVTKNFNSQRGIPTVLYSDGNPPPFDSWQPMPQQQSPPVPPPATPDYSSWGQPAAAPAPAPVTPDYSSWGQPAAAPAPAPVTQDYSSWGQPAAATPAAPAEPVVTATPTPVAVPTGGDPIEVLAASQQASVDMIASTLPDLEVKADLSWSGESVAGCSTTLDARDAVGSTNVAWLASVCVENTMSSLTIFNGPLTDVPNVLSRCLVKDGKLEVAISIRPRAYGAYEMVDEAGNYPGPEELGRKAFEYSGARMDFFEKFGTDEIAAALDASQFEGATPTATSELDKVTGGPLDLFVSMPITDGNVAKVVALREKVAASWLDWTLMDGNQHRPGAPINQQHVYDSKFRLNAYSALLPFYSQVFGDADGSKLAAAESGPLDEAYVGGGS